MEGRDPAQPVAATRIVNGADVNYGALTRNLLDYLRKQDGFAVHFSEMVTGLHRLPDGGWRVEVKNEATGARAQHRRPLRLPGRRRRRAHAAAEVRHPRGRRFRRLPGERHLAALRQARGGRPPHRQGLRHGGRGLAADVGAASRHAHHRRQALAAVRPLCRLLDQVPQARLAVRPAAVAAAGQHPAAARGGAGQFPARGISGRPGAAELGASLQGAARVLSRR